MSVCDVPVIAEVCATVGEGTASLISAPFDWLAHSMGSAAGWMFEAVWNAFDTTTLVDLTDPTYIDVYNVLFGVAVFVTLVFFCLQLITGLVHRDPTALSRAAIGLAKSVLGSFVIISMTGLMLEITDQVAVGVVQATGNTMEGMGDRVALLVVGLPQSTSAPPPSARSSRSSYPRSRSAQQRSCGSRFSSAKHCCSSRSSSGRSPSRVRPGMLPRGGSRNGWRL